MEQLKDVKFTILLTSDIHGNVLPLSYSDNTYKPQGLAKIASKIKEIRKKTEVGLLIDNGDLIQGTPLTYHYCKVSSEGINPMIEILNHLEYDAMVVGNHEFNYGKEILYRAQKESRFPWLSANILKEEDGQCVFGKPYIVKEIKGGIKLGVIGITTQYIPNWEDEKHIRGITFEDSVNAVERWVNHLRNIEQVDVVIVSYHGGFERDINTNEIVRKCTGENQAFEICERVKGIDVLLTGHQHKVIENRFINNVLVLQPGSHGRYIGVVNIVMKFTDKWRVKTKSSRVMPVKDSAEDPEIVSLVKDYERKVQLWLDKPIGIIKGGMEIENPLKARLRESAMAEFINKVQMKATGADISCASLFIEDIKGLKEKVTMRDIVSNYIYPNTLRVLRVRGYDIKAALERSATYFERYEGKEVVVKKKEGKEAFQPYNYDMWEGIEYKINISKEEGNRIEGLKYSGKPLNLEDEFEVVMNNYRAAGGGEYTMFKDKPVVREIPTDVSELIANYIIEEGSISTEVNSNWEVVF